jgi:hypothetical protein
VRGRLSRARDLLRDRLTRQGILLSDGVTGALALLCPRRMILPEAKRQAAVRLLGATVARSLDTLTKGVLFAMITEKLKQTGIFVVMGVFALGTVMTALMAYEGPLAKPGRLVADSAVQDGERNKPHETETVLAGETTSEDQTKHENQEKLRAGAEVEESYEKMDELLADAALIQIDLDVTTKLIEQTVESLAEPVSRSLAENAKRTATGHDPSAKHVEDNRKRLTIYLHEFKRNYKSKWADLARLKRQIARQLKTPGGTPEIAPTGTELGRRLDALEKKIDRIIDALPAK